MKNDVSAFAFSPDCQHVAVVSLDGSLRIINFVHEQYVVFCLLPL